MNNTLAHLQEHQAVMAQLEALIPTLEAVSTRIAIALKNGNKVFFMGNGGSASDAQHLAAELVGRYKAERRALAAIALTTDTSILTAISNDYDFSSIFSRQLEALCQKGDVVIGISTSGNSANVLKGIEIAQQLGAYTIGMTGEKGGKLAQLCETCFCVPSNTVARIQEAHIFIGHSICENIENQILLDETDLHVVAK